MKNAIFFVMLLMTGTVLGQASDNQIYINQVGQQATIVMEQTIMKLYVSGSLILQQQFQHLIHLQQLTILEHGM